jgi:hypothetical protein
MVQRCTKAVSNELQTRDQGCHTALTSFAFFLLQKDVPQVFMAKQLKGFEVKTLLS